MCKLKKFSIFLIVIGFLILEQPKNGHSETSPSPSALPTQSRWSLADQAFAERRSPEKARLALTLYREEFLKTPKDPEAAWRVAMGCYYIGIRLTQDPSEKEKLYAEGRDAGEKGIHYGFRTCAPCYFWSAINMALYAETVGIVKMVFSLSQIRKYLKKSISIDPKYMWAGAYRLEGLIERQLPAVFGGSLERSQKNFEKAIELAPDEPLNYLFLARLYSEKLNNPKEALKVASLGLKIPPPTPERVEAVDAMIDLQSFITETSKKLENKKKKSP